jgi:hypothetical protein
MMHGKLMTTIAALVVAWLACSPAAASTFFGSVPVGYSDNLFQINGPTSNLGIDIFANGSRDPTFCASCNSSYTDNYTVNLLDQTGTLQKSVDEINFFFFNMFNNSHGIGAGPVFVAVPAGVTSFEIISELSIVGLLGADGLPLGFGSLFISADGPISATTPLPATFPFLAVGLVALGLLGWRSKTVHSSYAT